MDYLDIFFTPEYAKVFEKTAFGGEHRMFTFGGISYSFFVRSIPDSEYFDIVSPYGYSGPYGESRQPSLWCPYLEAFHEYCLENKIVSEFARLHPFIKNHQQVGFKGGLVEISDVIYIDLTQSIEDIKRGMGKGNKSLMNGHSKMGVSTRRGDLSWFAKLYLQTMIRDNASPDYILDADFFNRTQDILGEHLITFEAWRDITSYTNLLGGSLFLCYGDYVHYWFSGTLSDGSGSSHDILCEAIKWAKNGGYKIFNLGGGLSKEDSLAHFKKTFSRAIMPFYTYRMIHNEDVYLELCKEKGIDAGLGITGYFPAYRR